MIKKIVTTEAKWEAVAVIIIYINNIILIVIIIYRAD